MLVFVGVLFFLGLNSSARSPDDNVLTADDKVPVKKNKKKLEPASASRLTGSIYIVAMLTVLGVNEPFLLFVIICQRDLQILTLA